MNEEMKLSEYLKEKSMGNVQQEKDVSIDELEEQIETARKRIKLERQKLKALKKKEEIERILANPEDAMGTPKWAYIIIVLLILIIIGGGSYYFLKDNNLTGSVIVETPNESTEIKTEPIEDIVYNLGDKIQLNNIAVVADSVDGRDKIGKYVGSTFAGVKAEGIYYVVNISLDNDGKKSVKLDKELLIVDSEDREYSADEKAESYYTTGKVLDLDEEIRPLLLREGVKIFDVPKTATGLKLIIKDMLNSDLRIKIDLESNGKIKVTNVDNNQAVSSSNEPGPMIKVSLTDVVSNNLMEAFLINRTNTFEYRYKLENLEKATLRCNVDEEVNGVINKDHQVLKLDAFEKEEFPEEISESQAANFTVNYITKCRFEGKLTETKDIKGFTAQFIN